MISVLFSLVSMTVGLKVDTENLQRQKVVTVPPSEEKKKRSSDQKVLFVMIKTRQYFTEGHTFGAAGEDVRVQHPVADTRWAH